MPKYDRWLNGNKAALDVMPHVQNYNIGANEWRSADEWPLPQTKYKKFFLDSDGSANSRYGDGRMSTKLTDDASSGGRSDSDTVHHSAQYPSHLVLPVIPE